jgi:succinoglycan biosynthesis transport protein ExoP
MSTHVSHRRWWLFSAVLLFLVAGGGATIAWLLSPKHVSVASLFEVRVESPSILGGPSAAEDRNYVIFKKTQMALIKSRFLLESALRNPKIRQSPVFASAGDPIEWLKDNLEVSYPQNGEILEIKLRGRKSQAEELRQVLDAVAAAYQKEVHDNEKSRRLVERDMLEHSLRDLNSELKRKYEDYLDIAKGMGVALSDSDKTDVQQQINLKRLDRIDEEVAHLEREQLRSDIDKSTDAKESSFIKQRLAQLLEQRQQLQKQMQARSAKSVELITRKSELDQLQSVANELYATLEKIDIDLEAGYRIRQLQPATIDPQQVASQ